MVFLEIMEFTGSQETVDTLQMCYLILVLIVFDMHTYSLQFLKTIFLLRNEQHSILSEFFLLLNVVLIT